MGKKSRQKQKNRAQKQQQPIKKTVPEFTVTIPGLQGMTMPAAPTSATPSAQSVQSPKSQPQNPVVGLGVSDEYIKTDILRIVTILGILVLLLIALVIVNDHSSRIQIAGNHLATFLKLQ